LFSFCLVFFIAGCGDRNVETKSFATASIAVAPLIDSVLATGRVETVNSVDVSSQLSGRIEEVYVDYNDTVSQGSPLARLDQSTFRSRVEELRASLAVSQAELLSAEAAVTGAQARYEEDARDYNRKADLARKGSVSDSEVSRAKAVQLQSQSALQMLAAAKEVKSATVAAATAGLHQAQIDLDRTVIRAPISGVVIKRSIEPGQTVAVSLSAPELFTIANDLREIEVHAHVDEADIGKIRAGQTVSFTVDAHPGRRFEGAVNQIRKAPEISQNVVSYTVVIGASNPDELMLPGMTALVEIVTAQKDKVLQVPNAALRFQMPGKSAPGHDEQDIVEASQSAVWVARHNDYTHEVVNIGHSNGEFSEVVSGNLEAGDEVIIGYRR
jgi:HlyD family secretion protein